MPPQRVARAHATAKAQSQRARKMVQEKHTISASQRQHTAAVAIVLRRLTVSIVLSAALGAMAARAARAASLVQVSDWV